MQKEGRKKTKLALKVYIVTTLIVVTFVIIAILSQINSTTLTIGGQTLNIEIAKSSQEKSRGLCCRDSLPEDQGMLFVYDSPGFYRFWMKDTKIPLDMFWIDSNKQIVHIEKSVQPSTYPEQSFSSLKPAKFILETNAGFANKYQIKKRDKVAF